MEGSSLYDQTRLTRNLVGGPRYLTQPHHLSSNKRAYETRPMRTWAALFTIGAEHRPNLCLIDILQEMHDDTDTNSNR